MAKMWSNWPLPAYWDTAPPSQRRHVGDTTVIAVDVWRRRAFWVMKFVNKVDASLEHECGLHFPWCYKNRVPAVTSFLTVHWSLRGQVRHILNKSNMKERRYVCLKHNNYCITENQIQESLRHLKFKLAKNIARIGYNILYTVWNILSCSFRFVVIFVSILLSTYPCCAVARSVSESPCTSMGGLSACCNLRRFECNNFNVTFRNVGSAETKSCAWDNSCKSFII